MSVQGIGKTPPPSYFGPNGLFAQAIQANTDNWTGAAEMKKAQMDRAAKLKKLMEEQEKNPTQATRQTTLPDSSPTSSQSVKDKSFKDSLDAMAVVARLRAEKAERQSSVPGPGTTQPNGQNT